MRWLIVVALTLGIQCACGDEGGFPWEELKDLYRAKIARELAEAEGALEGPPLAAIQDAHYHLRLHAESVEGTVTLTGSQLRGKPAPIPLFGPGLLLSETREVRGASLIPGDDGSIRLLPAADTPDFGLEASFVAAVARERGNRVLTLAIPAAVVNRVQVELDEGLRLLEAPGLPGADGSFHVEGTGNIVVRYLIAPDDGALPEMDLADLEPMEQQPVVLDAQVLRVAFDETGRSLSTLRLTLPPESDARLALKPVPGSEIWSLTVNGRPQAIYTDSDGQWIVPLERGRESIVELAFLREGEAVGLHGRLDVAVPHTGLPARMLYVGVDLPGRVALVSVEGPVNTAAPAAEGLPAGLEGAPYIFTQPFYKGEGIAIAVSYKEPVNR